MKCGLPVNDYVRFLLTKPPKKKKLIIKKIGGIFIDKIHGCSMSNGGLSMITQRHVGSSLKLEKISE